MVANTVLIASFAALAAALPAQDALLKRVPLAGRHLNGYKPRADGTVDGPLFLRNLNDTLKKYHSDHFLPSFGLIDDVLGLLKRAGTGTEPLIDQVDSGVDDLYYGSGTVGTTDVQTFTIDFDTGSADFFVPGPQCSTSAGCVGTTKYSQDGTDEGNTTSVTYGSGSITGENYFDTVCVAGLCATHTNVVSLTSASGFSTSDSNSLMGMGFSTIAESGQPTFFENLMAQGQVAKNEFGFYLGRAASGTAANSEMLLGGADASKYTGTVSAPNPVTTKGYWQLALDGVSVGGKKAVGTKGQAAIDTGTTVVLAPTVAALATFASIPGAFPVPLVSGSPTETIFAYPCDTTDVPGIIFGGTTYAINPLDFNFGTLTSAFAGLIGSEALLEKVEDVLLGDFCLAAIIGDDIDPTEELYVVGDTFIKNWYSIFSYDGGASVSFAKSV